MGGGKSTPDVPAAPPAPKQPQDVSRAAQTARDRQRTMLAKSRGVGSTNLTGGSLLATAPGLAKKTLLGQ